MKTKLFASALAMAVMTAGFAPSEVEAKPKHLKKAQKHYRKAHKHAYKHHKKHAKHYYKHHYGYHHPRVKVKYDFDDDWERENWGIYTTPTGGLGFHYSENSGSYFYPGYSEGFGINIGLPGYGGYYY